MSQTAETPGCLKLADDSLRRAHHVAGQAVMACVLGMALEEVALTCDTERAACWASVAQQPDISPYLRSLRGMLVVIAGEVVAARLLGTQSDLGDWRRVTAESASLGVSQEDTDYLCRGLRALVERILDRQPAILPAVRVLASALLERQSLSAAEVAAIVGPRLAASTERLGGVQVPVRSPSTWPSRRRWASHTEQAARVCLPRRSGTERGTRPRRG